GYAGPFLADRSEPADLPTRSQHVDLPARLGGTALAAVPHPPAGFLIPRVSQDHEAPSHAARLVELELESERRVTGDREPEPADRRPAPAQPRLPAAAALRGGVAGS